MIDTEDIVGIITLLLHLINKYQLLFLYINFYVFISKIFYEVFYEYIDILYRFYY